MDRSSLKNACDQVYRRYPAIKGCAPQVQSRADGQYLLIFRGSAQTADGRSMAVVVRAVASADGKLIKVTSSK